MISKTLAVILLMFTLCGCGLNLNSLRSDMEYKQLVKPLTKECDIKMPGLFKDVYVSALIVHKSLKSYIPNIPENKTRIDFYLRGEEQNFNIEKTIFTIKTDNGVDYIIIGIGSNNVLVNGSKTDNYIGYTVNNNKGGPNGNILNEFSLILPFELTNKLGTLSVNLEALNSENTCNMKWEFAD